jgi:DNA ligase-1
MSKIVKEWPLLQAKTRTGKTKFWQIRVLGTKNKAKIQTEYWQDDGTHQTADKEVKGKNIGRSNETTSQQQALRTAESTYTKQTDKGYTTDGKPTLQYELPMLAHSFTKRSHNIEYPCYIQPKLDGFRCMFDSKRGFWSRGGKPFEAADLSHLKFNTGGYILDGELMLPAPYSFQQTCKAIKKQREESTLLRFYLFDVVDAELGFDDRLDILEEMRSDFPDQVFIVPTYKVKTLDEAQAFYEGFIADGHEGMMFRNSSGGYLVGHRSANLQKYKEFEDAEFEITNVVDGVGKEKGAAVFVCITGDGQEFRTRPEGTYESRHKMFKNKKKFIGKQLTVRYQNLSDTGIPRFPVGVGLREDWDK